MMGHIVSTSTMGPKQQRHEASHAITTWTLQKGKPKRMSLVQIADNGFTEAEIRRAGRIVLLDHLWEKAMEPLDGDGGFPCKRYEFMPEVCTCIGTTPKGSRCLFENPPSSVADSPLPTRASQKGKKLNCLMLTFQNVDQSGKH